MVTIFVFSTPNNSSRQSLRRKILKCLGPLNRNTTMSVKLHNARTYHWMNKSQYPDVFAGTRPRKISQKKRSLLWVQKQFLGANYVSRDGWGIIMNCVRWNSYFVQSSRDIGPAMYVDTLHRPYATKINLFIVRFAETVMEVSLPYTPLGFSSSAWWRTYPKSSHMDTYISLLNMIEEEWEEFFFSLWPREQ